ncbi:xanthine dehydrogenase family protein molybdopterin-binding subunit [Pigmentiphaga soli]|uniref:Xanthine dehydrogenase family protein molybdopterin-binding subunit n=1 Tax=Pigmentiphaga soli TaxID=1007095 RepID=A0ABP8HHT3_9BURK
MNAPLIGAALTCRESARFATGRGTYVDDVRRPGMVHAVVVRAQVAHALIKGIHDDEARAMPGVLAVYRGSDFEPFLKPIPQRVCPLPGMENYAQLPIATDRVRYVGEPVAVVVAEDRYLAEDAAELVYVDCETLPAVVDAQQAIEGATLLHPAQGSNAATHYRTGYGDCEAAFRDAHLVIGDRFYVHRHSATPLETRGLVAEWDEAAGRLRIWGVAKVPFANRAILAGMLGLDAALIEMIEVDVGGSFGVRGDFYPEDFLVPFVARQLGRPVKWIEDRRESLQALNHSRDMHCELELAVDAQGRMLGMRGRLVADIGAYVRTNSGVMPGKGAQFLAGPYRIAATDFDVLAVVTNKTPSGTYRGPGRYETTFFRERLVDIAAARLGLDPAEFRRRNLIPPEAMPYDAGALVPGMGPTVYDSGNYPEVFRHALEKFGYAELAANDGRLIDGRYHGVGMGCFVESTGGGPAEHARLELRRGGGFDLYVGASSAGQGHETSMAQVLADALQVPYDTIRVHHGSTTLLDRGFGSYHSRSAVMSGSAVVRAAEAMRDKLLQHAAELSGLPAESLRYAHGTIAGPSGQAIAGIADIAAGIPPHAGHARGPFSADGAFANDRLTFTFGVQLAHVAVDPQTARVDVLKYFCVEDLGRMINPAIVHGQTIGAAVQGMGGTFLDEFVYDEHGQMLTGSFADYLLPTSTDFPNVDGETLELSPSPSNPLGVKGAGEGGIIATGAALSNAVSRALAAQGISITRLPMSMNNLGALLRAARETTRKETMNVNGEYTLEAGRDEVWEALMDPAVLQACIPGCERIARSGDGEYQLTVRAAVGPVSARMNAAMRLGDIVPGSSYTLTVEGKAGAAGFAAGSVAVALSDAAPGRTRLAYAAQGQLGGRLAQVGSRLVEGVAAKIAAEFFQRFQAQIGRPAPEAVPAPAAAPAPRKNVPIAWIAGATVVAAAVILAIVAL